MEKERKTQSLSSLLLYQTPVITSLILVYFLLNNPDAVGVIHIFGVLLISLAIYVKIVKDINLQNINKSNKILWALGVAFFWVPATIAFWYFSAQKQK